MKKFKKTINELIICDECEKLFINKNAICVHISKIHNSKIYFDKWIKDVDDDKCKICGKETEFLSLTGGYKKCCSKKCVSELKKLTCLNRFGVEYIYQSEFFKKNRKKRLKERYGSENYNNLEKTKQTKKEKYGDEVFNNRLKMKKTKKEKYGDENYNNRPKEKNTKKERYGNENYNNREKNKQTCLKHFGVENPQQDRNILEKGQKTSKLIKQFKNTDIWYQGSYEYDFIDKYLYRLPDIKRGFSISYVFQGKNRIYHPDFFILSLNLIVEIKSNYWFRQHEKEIEAKKQATITNGFNYILILDKKYNEFNNLLIRK
jgi:hypothetical protein